MTKCAICGKSDSPDGMAIWQPFGPHERVRDAFEFPGFHYRGFPALHVCDACRNRVMTGHKVQFYYKGTTYILDELAGETVASEDGQS
jgi:hypothetical protein